MAGQITYTNSEQCGLKAVLQEMSEAGVDWQLHSFGGAMHAFANPAANNLEGGTVFHPLACKRAFALCKAFLEELM